MAPRQVKQEREQRSIARVYYYHELADQIKDILESECGKWASNVPFNDVPGAFTERAMNVWVDEIMKSGRIILRIAHGLAIIKGDFDIKEDYIRHAADIYRKGIRNFMAEHGSQGSSSSSE